MGFVLRGLMAAVIVAVVSPCAFAYSGGDGTAGNPYQIADVNDFMQLTADPNNWDKAFIMTADIVLDPNNNPAHVFTRSPIVYYNNIFDGNGHVISNLTIDAPGKDSVGLFGSINLGGQIKNLGIENTDIFGDDGVGGLVGMNSGEVMSCYSSGIINGDYYVGGLSGQNLGRIISCYATNTITGNYVGGLVGANVDGTVILSYATGDVTGNYYVGGLIGGYFDGIILYCYSIGKPTGSYSVGGLCGLKNPSRDCLEVGNVWDIETSETSASAIGSGKTTVEMKNIATYMNLGWSFVQEAAPFGDWIMPDGDYPKQVWEVYSSAIIPNLKGLSEEQARDALETAGLLASETFSVNDTSIPTGFVSDTFPKAGMTVYAGLTPVHILLAKQTVFSNGYGTSTNPIQIRTLDDWFELFNMEYCKSVYFILMADFDFRNLFFTQAPIFPDTDNRTSGFQGAFAKNIVIDGNYHTISNLTIKALNQDFVGLFGAIDTNAQIKNMGLVNARIQGRNYVGAIAGGSSGAIMSCYAEGDIMGTGYMRDPLYVDGIGGLTGVSSGMITSCYADSTVSGGSNVGGLVGNNSYLGTITSSYADSTVSGGSNVGGLVGNRSSGTITSCYSKGKVSGSSSVGGLIGSGPGVTTNCFWDKETSGQTFSVGGTGKTTVEMKMLATFANAGWDFGDTWAICEGTNYPRLQWQIPAGDWVCPDGVRMEDFGYLAGYWMETTPNGDLSGDGVVGIEDLILFCDNWMGE